MALATKKPKLDSDSWLLAADKASTAVGSARTSSLAAPTMLLTGQEGEILTCRFDPTGTRLASGSFDKSIYLWQVYGNCVNDGVLKGHAGAVLDLKWTRDGQGLVSVSADKTLAQWDAETGQRVKKFRGHTDVINATDVALSGTVLFASASDDRSVRIWDPRYKHPPYELDHPYQVTAVALHPQENTLYSGGIDNYIYAWDIRRQAILYKMEGHSDAPTGLEASPDGQQLLSNAMDNTVRIWDIKPVPSYDSRCLKLFEGASHGFEKNLIRPSWSPSGHRIACGSADRSVLVWDAITRKVIYKIPGHKGSVNQVQFSPKEPSILMSCSSDRQIYLTELD